MPRHCLICDNPRRTEIDHAIVKGVAFTEIADLFHLHRCAVQRHARRHVIPDSPGNPRPSPRAAVVTCSRLEALFNKLDHIVESEGRINPALSVRTMSLLLKVVELQYKLFPKNGTPEATHDFHDFTEIVRKAMEPFPEARAAVQKAYDDYQNSYRHNAMKDYEGFEQPPRNQQDKSSELVIS